VSLSSNNAANEPARASASRPLEDYALIGDCRGAALVSKAGSIDWLCAPRFDSPACFAALLGSEANGHWSIAPSVQYTVKRRYLPQTLVLETLFECASGSVALLDCMARTPEHTQLIRSVEGRSGSVTMQMTLVWRFDYGRVVPWVLREAGVLRAIAGPLTARLYTDVPVRGENLHSVAEFEVRAGERIPFVMTLAASHVPAPTPLTAADALADTTHWWTGWSARSLYQGPYREPVQRSLLVLKSLTYEPTGGIVAAPTTSLPEQLGASRNWDYRFCWLRDATITLHTLLSAGYSEEAAAWREWLLRAVAGDAGQVQVMYGIHGERRLPEFELPWLSGYEGSKPVRIGNGAHSQLQLDVFGELMDAMHQSRRANIESDQSWALERNLLCFLEEHWRDRDASIWEVRGSARHFTYSKVMAWVAFDRAIQAVERFGRVGSVERWRAIRSEIHAEVCERGWNRELNAFVQSYDSDVLDASLLQIALVGFLPIEDPRVQGTVAAIERELLIDDTFVRRYKPEQADDGVAGDEGAFLACSFWLVNNRAMQGRLQEAHALFQRLLALCNDVGLLAEEYAYEQRRQVGNFPQAFSHLALVDAAKALWDAERGGRAEEHRARLV
jgi:GH15 family glucan-1,4-alpha-glucosidase